MILLTDDEIVDIVKGFVYSSPDAEPQWWKREYKKLAKSQLKKVGKDLTELLEDDAFHGQRIAAVFNYLEALLKEVE